jgi:hypothetical protein
MNNTETCEIVNQQLTLLLNEFSSKLGQILAVAVSATFLVPMYNFYKLKVKSD